ncbi:unnamed protein product [Symbiodinium pilosum]|uniref:Uncharacterized protein n=1 Tax=Symbiodinium pilosum TaxID=2952 RepID=A0A812MT61_SYMPI|nr:unnamed protein product [Symbiodinium pilosum]
MLPPAPDGLKIAQARLSGALLPDQPSKGAGPDDRLDLAHNGCPPRKRGYDHYIKLEPNAGRVLEAAAGVTGVPTDHLLVAALAAALSAAAGLAEVKLSLIVPMRDGPGHGQAVANLASTRHLSVWVHGRSLIEIALDLSMRFRRRDWQISQLLDDDGDRLFINLRSIPAFDGASPVIEPQDTTRSPTRFVRNIVEMFADQETLHSWTLWLGLRDDVSGEVFSRVTGPETELYGEYGEDKQKGIRVNGEDKGKGKEDNFVFQFVYANVQRSCNESSERSGADVICAVKIGFADVRQAVSTMSCSSHFGVCLVDLYVGLVRHNNYLQRRQKSAILAWSAWDEVFLAPRQFPQMAPISVDVDKVSLEDQPMTVENELLPALPMESRRVLMEQQPHPGFGAAAYWLWKACSFSDAMSCILDGGIGECAPKSKQQSICSGKTLAYLLPALQRAREADEDADETSTGSEQRVQQRKPQHYIGSYALHSIALFALSRELAVQTLAEAEDLLDVFDKEDAEDVKDLLGRVEVVVLDELDELLPKRKYTGRKLARYQDPGMWPAEGLLKRLMRNNERESLQVVAASATAYRSSRLRLEKVLKRDKLKRFPVPLPRLDPQRSSAASVEAAAAARSVAEDEEVEERQALEEDVRERSMYRALPGSTCRTTADESGAERGEEGRDPHLFKVGIQHLTWKAGCLDEHEHKFRSVEAMPLHLAQLWICCGHRRAAALVFVCPNAGETVKSVVQDLQTAGWSGADALTRLLFPDSRTVSGKASKQRGEAKGWRSANRLLDVRDTTRRGYLAEGDFYREAPILVSAEESVRGLHLDAVEAVFILGLPKNGGVLGNFILLAKLGHRSSDRLSAIATFLQPPSATFVQPPVSFQSFPAMCVVKVDFDCSVQGIRALWQRFSEQHVFWLDSLRFSVERSSHPESPLDVEVRDAAALYIFISDRGSCCGSDAFYRQYTRAVVIDLPFQQHYALRTLAGSLLKPRRMGHCSICKPQRNNDLAALPVPTKNDDRDTFLEEAAVGESLVPSLQMPLLAIGLGGFPAADAPRDRIVTGKESISHFAWEQARLKSLKGQVFLDYTKFSAAQAASAFTRRLSGALPDPLPNKDVLSPLSDGSASPVSSVAAVYWCSPDSPSGTGPGPFSRTFSDWTRSSDWLGKTMKEAWIAQVRCGTDYKNKRQHMTTDPGHMQAAGSEAVWQNDFDMARSEQARQMYCASKFAKSYVGFFEITNETVAQVNSSSPAPCVRMFRKFCEGPGGEPGCAPDHPDRSAYRRRDTSKRKDMDAGLLRAAGWCLNQAELGVPEFLHQFNGKSFVIADSGYVIKDPDGEWLEVGFDVRKFPFLFVDVLYNFRDFIPLAKCHYGFTVQAVEDEDLPEGIICDVYMSGISITDDPRMIEPPEPGPCDNAKAEVQLYLAVPVLRISTDMPVGQGACRIHAEEPWSWRMVLWFVSGKNPVTKGFLTETGISKWEAMSHGISPPWPTCPVLLDELYGARLQALPSPRSPPLLSHGHKVVPNCVNHDGERYGSAGAADSTKSAKFTDGVAKTKQIKKVPTWNVKTWVDDLYSGEEKKKHRSEAAARLDAALGGPVRRLRKRV